MIKRNQIGRRGEIAATRYLQTKGWKIIKSNYRLGKKEIDIIASYQGNISLFEIKTRNGASADYPIGQQQKKSLRQAHLEFCEKYSLEPSTVAYALLVLNYQGQKAILTYYPDFL